MESRHEEGEAGRPDHDKLAAASRLVESIAGALRAEFGVAIDAHPGGFDAEAGTVNRAFLAAVGVILGGVILPGDDPAVVRTSVLRRAALRRLDRLGLVGPRAESLLDQEPTLGDRWLAYMALAPASV